MMDEKLDMLCLKLCMLDDRHIQMFLKNIDMDDLVSAFPEFPEELQRTIRTNMSTRACYLLEEMLAKCNAKYVFPEEKVVHNLWNGYVRAVNNTVH